MSSFLPPAPVLHPLTPPNPHASALLDISSGTAFCSGIPAPSLPSENRRRMLGYKRETHRGPGVQSMGKDTGPEVSWGFPIVCEGLGGGWAKEEWPPDHRTERLEVRAPPVKWEGGVSEASGRGLGWGPAFADACLSSPVLPSTFSRSIAAFASVLGLCVSGCHPIHLCLPPGPPPSLSGADLFLLLGVSVSLHFPVLAFCSLFLSPRLTLGHFYVYFWSLAPLSVFHVPSTSLPVSACHL